MDWSRSVANFDYGWILPAIARFPAPVAYRLSDLRAWVRFRSRTDTRLQALQNIAEAFPDFTPEEVQRTTLEGFRVQCRDEMESYWLDRPIEFLRSRVAEENLEVLEEARKRERGVLFYTVHLGNPGIFLALAGRLGYPMNLVLRPLEDFPMNPRAWLAFGNSRVERLERAVARKILPAGKVSYFTLRRLLREGETVVMAIDVVPSLVTRTTTVDFLGQASRFPLGPARLVLDTRPSVVLWSVHGASGNRYRFLLEDLTEAIDQLDSIADVTRVMVENLEARLRLQPGAWLQWDALHHFWV